MYSIVPELHKIVDLKKELIKRQIADAFWQLSKKDQTKVFDSFIANAADDDLPEQYDCQVYTGKADWACDCAEWGIGQVTPITWTKVQGGYAFIG